MSKTPDFPADMDLVSIERHARILQAQALSDGLRALRLWIASKLSPSETTGEKATV